MAQIPAGVLVFVFGVVLFLVIYFVGKKSMEKFGVPVKPSMYQDKRYVTPAGNTIVY